MLRKWLWFILEELLPFTQCSVGHLNPLQYILAADVIISFQLFPSVTFKDLFLKAIISNWDLVLSHTVQHDVLQTEGLIKLCGNESPRWTGLQQTRKHPLPCFVIKMRTGRGKNAWKTVEIVGKQILLLQLWIFQGQTFLSKQLVFFSAFGINLYSLVQVLELNACLLKQVIYSAHNSGSKWH